MTPPKVQDPAALARLAALLAPALARLDKRRAERKERTAA